MVSGISSARLRALGFAAQLPLADYGIRAQPRQFQVTRQHAPEFPGGERLTR